MSANEMVLQKLDAGLLTITMNRPDRRNALNPDMTRGLVEAARRAAEDHEVRAVLIKGAGGTFCVGGDVKSMAEGRAPLGFEAKMANLRRGMEVSRILHQMPKPVVAQLDGAAPARASRSRCPVGLAHLYRANGRAKAIPEVLATVLADFNTERDLPEIEEAETLLRRGQVVGRGNW